MKGLLIGFFIFLFFLFITICNFIYKENWLTTVAASKELDPIDLLGLILSTTATFLLAWYITKRLQEQRYEKEFLISDLRNLENEVILFNNTLTQSTTISLENVLSTLGKIDQELYKFNQTADILDISCAKKNQLKIHQTLLFSNATDTDGAVLEIADVNRRVLNKICNDYSIAIRQLIRNINKH
jgi:hypothetical protein